VIGVCVYVAARWLGYYLEFHFGRVVSANVVIYLGFITLLDLSPLASSLNVERREEALHHDESCDAKLHGTLPGKLSRLPK
jgi:hypothetical protein